MAEPDDNLVDYRGPLLVWIGNFESNFSYENYFEEKSPFDESGQFIADYPGLNKFAEDFKIGVTLSSSGNYNHDFLCRVFELSPKPVMEILLQLWHGKGFAGKAVDRLGVRLIVECNCAVALYGYDQDYDVYSIVKESPLFFIGKFFFNEGVLVEVYRKIPTNEYIPDTDSDCENFDFLDA